MWPTASEISSWMRCRLKAFAIAVLILVAMGLIGVIASLASS
jgi:hypothetical protein